MPEFSKNVQKAIADDLARSGPVSKVEPTKFDVYVASSGLQKAIRRGDLDAALRCASRLLLCDPTRFWRRIVTIALEDVGVGNLDALSRIVFSGDVSWRKDIGEWPLAAHLVELLCQSVKDRTTDELIVLCQHQRALQGCRTLWAFDSDNDLAARLLASSALESAALAAWYLGGTKRHRNPYLGARSGDIRTVWTAYRAHGFGGQILQASELGAKRGDDVLAIFLPLVWRAFSSQVAQVIEPELRHAPKLGDLPAYVFDAFTRYGLTAIADFIGLSKPWRAFLERNVERRAWKSVTADVLFRAESELTNRRLSWPIGDRIVSEARKLIPDLPQTAAQDAIDVLSSELCLMDLARHEAISRRVPNLG